MGYSRGFSEARYPDGDPALKRDLMKAVKDLEDSFHDDICAKCGKPFYQTYFVVCPDCVTKISNAMRKPID